MTILSPAALMLVCPTEEVVLLMEEVVCLTEEAILHFFLHQSDDYLSAIAP